MQQQKLYVYWTKVHSLDLALLFFSAHSPVNQQKSMSVATEKKNE